MPCISADKAFDEFVAQGMSNRGKLFNDLKDMTY